jgi:hypothetical protein
MGVGVLQRTVAEMVSDGADLAEVESALDSIRLGEEEKSALWLLAWSAHEPERRLLAPEPAAAEDELGA